MQEAWQNLIGLTQQAILDRQRCNGDCSRPLAFELDPILRKIGARLAQVAKGLYLRAEAEENRIAIKFDGWLPAEKPTDAFTKKWTGLVNTASGNVTCLFPRDADSIPGANGDVPRDDRNTCSQFVNRIAARVAAAAPSRPLPPARSTVTGPDAPTRVLARIPPGAGPGQLLRLQRPDGSGCFLAHTPAHATAGMVVAFAVPPAGGGVVGGGSGQGGARVESSNHITT